MSGNDGKAVTLKRVTLNFSEQEDRVRLVGERSGQGVEVLWLSQRLLRRLVPALLRWLDEQVGVAGRVASSAGTTVARKASLPRPEVLNEFAQQSARAQLKAEPAVKPGEDCTSWLVISLNLTMGTEALRVTFCGAGQERAAIELQIRQLRQWLNILYDVWRRAEWSMDVWPDWMELKTPSSAGTQPVLH